MRNYTRQNPPNPMELSAAAARYANAQRFLRRLNRLHAEVPADVFAELRERALHGDVYGAIDQLNDYLMGAATRDERWAR